MSDEAAVVAYGQTFDIPVKPYLYKNPLSKLPIFAADMSGRKTIPVLRVLVPYLRIKRPQATLILELETSKLAPGLRSRQTGTFTRKRNGKDVEVKSYSFSQELVDRWEAIREESHRLNRPGRDQNDSDDGIPES